MAVSHPIFAVIQCQRSTHIQPPVLESTVPANRMEADVDPGYFHLFIESKRTIRSIRNSVSIRSEFEYFIPLGIDFCS